MGRRKKWKKIDETTYERTDDENVRIEETMDGKYKINHQKWSGRNWIRHLGNYGVFDTIEEAQKEIEEKFDMEEQEERNIRALGNELNNLGVR